MQDALINKGAAKSRPNLATSRPPFRFGTNGKPAPQSLFSDHKYPLIPRIILHNFFSKMLFLPNYLI
jgi:hypothetical protein